MADIEQAPSVPHSRVSLTITIDGDSLSSGYGVAPAKDWVALLVSRLAMLPCDIVVSNLSRPSAALSTWTPREKPQADIVLLALGGMDALSRVPIASVEPRVNQAIAEYSAAGASVILIGVDVAPVSDKAYADGLRDMFTAVARRRQTRFVPDILRGVPRIKSMFQIDGVHPTAAAQGIMLENVWPSVSSAVTARGCSLPE